MDRQIFQRRRETTGPSENGCPAVLPADDTAEFNTATHQRYKATVAYDGTDFEGWQVQFTVTEDKKCTVQSENMRSQGQTESQNRPNDSTVTSRRIQRKTIQGCIEHRLSRALCGSDFGITIAGSGRTDAGVHASAQVFHFEAPRSVRLASKLSSQIVSSPQITNNVATGGQQPEFKAGVRRPQGHKKKPKIPFVVNEVPVNALLLLNLLRTGLPASIQVLSVELCSLPVPQDSQLVKFNEQRLNISDEPSIMMDSCSGQTLERPFCLPSLASHNQSCFFHARESCKWKRYSYYVCEGVASPFHTRYCWSLPQLSVSMCATNDSYYGAARTRVLDVSAMREAAKVLEGQHDFTAFGVIEPNDFRSPLKTMRRLTVTRYLVTKRGSVMMSQSKLGKKRSIRVDYCDESRQLDAHQDGIEEKFPTSNRNKNHEDHMNPFFFPDIQEHAVECDDINIAEDDAIHNVDDCETLVFDDLSAVFAACSPSQTFVRITAECDRFLYNMMRLISGTLVQVGLGKMKPADVKLLLESRSRTAFLDTGRTGAQHSVKQQHIRAYKAPAQGLVLEKVFYE